MKVLFRCDSSLLIGTGHVMRCLTLASLLREEGHEVLFVTRRLEGNIIVSIEEKQFKVIPLPAPESPYFSLSQYDNWRAVPLEQEIGEMHEILRAEEVDWIVVDHYGLPKEWEIQMKKTGPCLMVIDDIFRDHACDAFLDQNFHPDHEAKLLFKPPEYTYLGPRYALLSEQFRAISPKNKLQHHVGRILAFFGGTDPTRETLRFLKIFSGMRYSIPLTVVVGRTNPHIPALQEYIKKMSGSELIIQTKEMAALMDSADLFVGAGGSITWEKAYLGLPSLTIAIADNQVEFSRNLHEKGVHLFLGLAQEVSNALYEQSLRKIIEDDDLRKTMSSGCRDLEVGSRTYELAELFRRKQD